MTETYLSKAKKFVCDHDSCGKWSPFTSCERLVLEAFAKFLDSKNNTIIEIVKPEHDCRVEVEG